MKNTIVLLFVLSLSISQIFSQAITLKSKFNTRNEVELMKFDNEVLKATDFAGKYYEELGLDSAKDLMAYKRIQSLNGWIRIRHKQSYKGLRVVGAEYVLHEKDNLIKKSSGVLLPYINLNTKPAIKAGEAIVSATEFVNSSILSKAEGKAIVLPKWDVEQAELVIMDSAYPKFSGEYILTYHVIVSNLEIPNQYRENY